MSRSPREEVPFDIRCAIITLHGVVGWSYAAIGRVPGIDLARGVVSKIVNHATTSAQIATGTSGTIPWDVQLEYCAVSGRSGRRKKVDPETKSKFRQALLDQPNEHPTTIAQDQLGLPIYALTARRMALSPSPIRPFRIVRRKKPKKYILNSMDMFRRRQYCQWLVRKIFGYIGETRPKKKIFVMSDETPLDFGGPGKHDQWCNALEGSKSEDLLHVFQPSRLQFTIQTLAACSSDLTIKRPVKCFIKDDKLEKQKIWTQL
jgi:hypothetical protein